MFDRKKRTTLKILGATGAAIATPPLATAALTSGSRQPEVPQSGAGHTQHDIEIIIVDTGNMPENTVIVTNRTTIDVRIYSYLPGTVVYKDQAVSLNKLLGPGTKSADRVLSAGHSMSAGYRPDTLDSGFGADYLWAGAAVSPLTENTDIITLAATLNGNQAIVFVPFNADSTRMQTFA